MSKYFIKKPKFGHLIGQLAVYVVLAISTANVHAGLIGVKTIEISNSIGDWLQVAEFQAFDMSNVNVALSTAGATASAPDSWNLTSTPDKAIDGNTNGNFNLGNIFHEGSNFSKDTLTISLLTPTELSSITIFGRTDCCSNRDIYKINFLDSDGAVLRSLSSLNATDTNNHQASFRFPDSNNVPEPAPLALLALGFLVMAFARRWQTTDSCKYNIH